MQTIYNKKKHNSWCYLFAFEAAGLVGRLLFNHRPPTKSRLLHLGSGGTYLDNFVNADFYYLRYLPFVQQTFKTDWLHDFRRPLNCPDSHWEGVFSEHTLEHLHYGDCLALFKELRRTMQRGAWLRICVPDACSVLDKPQGTLAESIYHLAQNWGHVSTWDFELMAHVLRDAGFETIHHVSYMCGADARLLCDTQTRREGSLYVEAQA
jgi:predicted SAM-dependent methyltransferase